MLPFTFRGGTVHKKSYAGARPGSSSPNRRLRSIENFSQRSEEPGFRQTWNGHRTRRDAIAAGVAVPTLTVERCEVQ